MSWLQNDLLDFYLEDFVQSSPSLAPIPQSPPCKSHAEATLTPLLFDLTQRSFIKQTTRFKNKQLCSYITAHIAKKMVSAQFLQEICKLCVKHRVSFQSLKRLKADLIGVSGPVGLKACLKSWMQKEEGVSRVFIQFGIWYLKHSNVKIKDRESYMKYKRLVMIPLLIGVIK